MHTNSINQAYNNNVCFYYLTNIHVILVFYNSVLNFQVILIATNSTGNLHQLKANRAIVPFIKFGRPILTIG